MVCYFLFGDDAEQVLDLFNSEVLHGADCASLFSTEKFRDIIHDVV